MTVIAGEASVPLAADARRLRPSAAPSSHARADTLGSPAASGNGRHRLLLQFMLLNLAAFALLAAAHIQGWTATVVDADGTRLSLVIFAVFLAGLAICVRKIWQISNELACVRNFDPCRRSWATTYLAEVKGRGAGSRAMIGSALRARIFRSIAVVRHTASSLVLLGLIGTVLGFIIALSGVDPRAAGDVRAIAPMVTDLIGGMSVALYTTLVGAVLNLWLTVNYNLLAAGAGQLVTDLVSLGERNARIRPR